MVFRDSANLCPRCGTQLSDKATVVGHRFLHCHRCFGNWVTLQTLTDILDRLVPGRGLPVFGEPGRGDSRTLGCPVCGAPMRRKLHYRLELDLCARHGVWFDGAELEQTLLDYAIREPPAP